VAVIDAQSLKVMKYILVGRRVWHLELTPDGTRLLATNGISGDVSVIDTQTLSVVKTIAVGRYPWGVAVKP
jgi:YVTN family beta-propeller protein